MSIVSIELHNSINFMSNMHWLRMPYDKIENKCIVVFVEKQTFLAIVKMELEFDVVVFGASKLGSIVKVVL